MQFINDRARRIAEARVITAVLGVANHGGWNLDGHAPTILSSRYRNYFYVPQAELLLVPAIGHVPYREVGELVHETRSDALCIMVGRTTAGALQVYASICEWSRQGAHWWGPHMAWADPDQTLWFVPDPDGENAPAPSFRIGARRLTRIDDRPLGEHVQGLMGARAIFSALEGC